MRFQRYRKKITPKKEAALSRKDHPEPAPAKPPRAGPKARATLKPAEFNATAEACRPGETISGVIACHAGSFITAPSPSRNVKISSIQGLTTFISVNTPR